jgi:hypothetical protein
VAKGEQPRESRKGVLAAGGGWMNRKVTSLVKTQVLVLGLFLFLNGCQTTIGNMSFWARPAIAIPSRAVEVDDGAEYHYVERYEPRGDSMFIMVRIYPKGEKENQSLVNTKLRSWPTKLVEKVRERD